MKKEFARYVIPSMISFLFSGIYVSIDGLFIGQSVGDAGLAGINIAWPLAAIILAMGTGIGMGGAVIISNHKGANETEKAEKALGNTITLLLIASAALTVFFLLFTKPIVQLLGAQGQVLEYATQYVTILGAGSVLQIMGTGIIPLLRNQNKAWMAMALMLTNFVLDTVLSGVFVMVLGYGVAGAALATLFGQSLALIPSLFILFHKKNRVSAQRYILEKKTVWSILKVGISPAALSFLPSFTIFLMNLQALTYGGTTAVAAFAVGSYVLSVGQLLLEGISDGSQPLVSFHHGAGNEKAVRQIRRWTYTTALVTGIVMVTGMILLKNVFPIFFGVSKETEVILSHVLPLCAASLPFYAFSRSSSAYFYAIKETRSASIMVYGEALVILPACVFILPNFLGLAGVWAALTASQVILMILAIVLLKRQKRIQNLQQPMPITVLEEN